MINFRISGLSIGLFLGSSVRLFVALVCAQAACAQATSVQGVYAEVTKDGHGAVATVQPLATQAAIKIYALGGNAVDAAITAALTLGVVDGHNSGLGGGCFVLLHRAYGTKDIIKGIANSTIEALDGRETAPALATRDMYLRNGKVVSSLSRTGALAVGIPGSLAAYEYMSKTAGKLKFSTLLLQAAELAEKGFAIDAIYAKRIARHAKTFRQFPGSAAILLDKNKQPWPVGHQLIQKDLAVTYRAIAAQGSDYFYRGDFSKRVGAWMKSQGGLVRAGDFADYKMKVRQPIVSDFAGYQVYGFAPPSSGGVHVAQILTMLNQLDEAKYRGLYLGDESVQLSAPERYHYMAESMKLAFADRAHWMGDPDFVKVPKGLLNRDYLRQQAARIQVNKVLQVGAAGIPPKAELDIFEKHTTHISTADKDGNWVSITTTVNTDFGSKVIVPGTGVFLNNQMDDFSAQPGVANIYGLVGSEANAIAPGKRPLSSMSPTLVLKNGKPILSLGAAGGPTIISQVVQVLDNNLRGGMSLSAAVAAPRIHHQWRPDALYLEKYFPAKDRAALQVLGHKLKTLGPYGSTQAIGLDDNGQFVAVAEPRLLERNRVSGASVSDAKGQKSALPEKRYIEVEDK